MSCEAMVHIPVGAMVLVGLVAVELVMSVVGGAVGGAVVREVVGEGMKMLDEVDKVGVGITV